MKVAENVLELIGKNPLVKLNKISRGMNGGILAKPEYLNPSGSIKDKVALRMIEEAEKEGVLKSGYTIVDASTGNTGISLSLVGTIKGYKVVIYETIPGRMGQEKMKIMKNYGAEVRLITPKDASRIKEKSVAGAEVELPGRKICLDLEKNNSDVWWARQFSNPNNVKAHKDTAQEILSQVGRNVKAFVATIGTGGTLMGIAQVLKKELPTTEIIGIQPASSRVNMSPGKPYPRSDIEGGIVSEMLEKPGLIDEIVRIPDEEAVEMTHRLWREEGLFAGVSSGANVLVSMRKAKKLREGEKVVTVLPDSGDRYLKEEHFVT